MTFKSEHAFPLVHALVRFTAPSFGKVDTQEADRLIAAGAHVVALDAGDDDAAVRTAPLAIGDEVTTLVAERGFYWLTRHLHSADRCAAPGNRFKLSLPPQAPSRAWLKMQEAIARFDLAIDASSRVLEIGAAPGGASHALLSRGAQVVGVDPTEMDARIKAHDNFTYVPMPSTRLVPGEIDGAFDWLVLDVNVPPGTALRGASPFIEAHASTLRGLVLTLKLRNWDMVLELPNWLERIAHRVPHLELEAWSGFTHHQELGVVGRARDRGH